jgi:dipeptidase E
VRLLLCSAGLGALEVWVADSLGDRRSVAFVDVASQPLGSPPFITECREALAANGCAVVDLDLTLIAGDRLSASLAEADAVFVSGGFPIYLLEWAQRSGFLSYTRQAVRAGRLSYIGVSAGAPSPGPA